VRRCRGREGRGWKNQVEFIVTIDGGVDDGAYVYAVKLKERGRGRRFINF